jgi:hypothetical protein
MTGGSKYGSGCIDEPDSFRKTSEVERLTSQPASNGKKSSELNRSCHKDVEDGIPISA